MVHHVFRNPEFSAPNVLASASGGVAAALALSYFGAAGSLLGAALGPVVFLFAKELVKQPANRAVERMPRPQARTAAAEPVEVEGAAGQGPARPRRRLHVRVVALTAAVATLLAVALITVPELVSGSSMVSSRRTTLFSSSPSPAAPHASTTPERDRPTTTGGADVVAPAAGPSTTTAPAAATDAPAPAAAPQAPATPTPTAPAPAPAPQASPAPEAAPPTSTAP